MKPWRNEIQQHIQVWSERLGNLGWWPRFVYHFTDVQNAAQILADGIIYCRVAAESQRRMAVDNASPEVIAQTRAEHMRYARLYFRPRTPTQFRNEGIRPPTERELGGAHCPVPIYFCFDALEMLSQDTTEFSNGNMGSSIARHSSEKDFFFTIPFHKVFHSGAFLPEFRDEIVFHRNAEVLIPELLPLEPNLKFIACRSEAERQTLMHLLPYKLAQKWESKIRLGEQGFFERKWTFVEEVVVVDQEVTFRFNPSTLTPGPFDVRIDYTEQNSHPTKYLHKRVDQLNGVLRVRLADASWGEIRLYLDDALAFSDTIFFEEISF